jgi:hypothetical protein
MQRFSLLVLGILLIAGCGKKDTADQQAGNAAQSSYTEVMDQKNGFIVENAAIAGPGATAVYSEGEGGAFQLAAGTSSVLIVQSAATDKQPGYLLALQYPAFAPGAVQEYGGEGSVARFFLITKDGAKLTYAASGLISGSVRFTKKEPATFELGLNREMQAGIGTMDVVVSAIAVGSTGFAPTKTFSATYQMPIITLNELARVKQPV